MAVEKLLSAKFAKIKLRQDATGEVYWRCRELGFQDCALVIADVVVTAKSRQEVKAFRLRIICPQPLSTKRTTNPLKIIGPMLAPLAPARNLID